MIKSFQNFFQPKALNYNKRQINHLKYYRITQFYPNKKLGYNIT